MFPRLLLEVVCKLLVASVTLLLGCNSVEEKTVPIPNSTARLDQVYRSDIQESELDMIIMTTPKECEYVVGNITTEIGKKEYDACLPWLDRHAGEMKLSIRFELDEQPFHLPLIQENLQVSLDKTQIVLTPPTTDLRVIGHNPVRIKQLFILMIDGSNSMNIVDKGSTQTRMEKVQEALLKKSVTEAFFPENVNNSVVIYTFTQGNPRPLGGSVQILSSAKAYSNAIKQHLKPQGGYTHLYDSIEYGMTNALKEPAIQQLLDGETKPTLVVLTDGFNNEAASDSCATNAPRLQKLLDSISKKMKNQTMETPMIFTVGLGKSLNPKFDVIDSQGKNVSVKQLCGKNKAKSFIDAPGNSVGLEDLFIDNVSLQMIADRGYGRSFIRRDADGLGEAFAEAAALRYQWFEVQYRDNALKFRKEFENGFKLLNYAKSLSFVNVYPHAWLDGPSGTPDADGWSQRSTVWHSTSILTSGVGIFLFLMIVGAAIFNIKRLLLGRLQRK